MWCWSSARSSGDILLEQALKFDFKTSNNQAEYEAIIVGLNLELDMEAKQLTCRRDSQLIVEKFKGEFEVKESLLQRYYHFIQNLITKFINVRIEHIIREHNTEANMLSWLETVKKKGLQRSINYINLKNPNVGSNKCMATEVQTNSMTPIKQFLDNGDCETQPERTMRQQVARFVLSGHDLYRREYTWPLLKCISPGQADYVM
ncbi:uncharacterized protein [Phaseolus vulgaris]|uniref:uncharacterized protein n=1 Tax=Phaseolus vulgaris TaxID=3885 RepID=UPI0035CAFA00